jgi:hypothetical protein
MAETNPGRWIFFYIVVEMDVESGWRAYLVKKGNK